MSNQQQEEEAKKQSREMREKESQENLSTTDYQMQLDSFHNLKSRQTSSIRKASADSPWQRHSEIDQSSLFQGMEYSDDQISHLNSNYARNFSPHGINYEIPVQSNSVPNQLLAQAQDPDEIQLIPQLSKRSESLGACVDYTYQIREPQKDNFKQKFEGNQNDTIESLEVNTPSVSSECEMDRISLDDTALQLISNGRIPCMNCVGSNSLVSHCERCQGKHFRPMSDAALFLKKYIDQEIKNHENRLISLWNRKNDDPLVQDFRQIMFEPARNQYDNSQQNPSSCTDNSGSWRQNRHQGDYWSSGKDTFNNQEDRFEDIEQYLPKKNKKSYKRGQKKFDKFDGGKTKRNGDNLLPSKQKNSSKLITEKSQKLFGLEKMCQSFRKQSADQNSTQFRDLNSLMQYEDAIP